MASLDDLDDDNSSSSTESKESAPALRTDTTSPTLVGDPHAAAPVVQPTPTPPAAAPRMGKTRPARTRAGKDGSTKSESGDESEGDEAGKDGGKEPFVLPADTYRSIVDEATRDAAIKAKLLVLEDEGFSRHLINEVVTKLAATKAEEAERTPTLAAIETPAATAEEVTDGEVLEVIPLPIEEQKTKTTETAKTKKSGDNDWGYHLAVIAVILFVVGLVAYAVYPRSPEREETDATTSDRSDAATEEDASALSSARQIAPAPDAGATTEEIEAFKARVPYSRLERLMELRRLRGTGLEDNQDMDCGGTGMNFSTRAFISRETSSGTDTRPLTQAEAMDYFADATNTGEHTIQSVDGPRHYTVYLDLAPRTNETGSCNFFIGNR